jgi:hypothetical protein
LSRLAIVAANVAFVTEYIQQNNIAFLRIVLFFRYCKYLLSLLYLSRIGVISSLIGILIFSGAPQAQDLFLEVRSSPWMDRTFWTVFYILLIFVWLLPIYFWSLRMIEEGDDNDLAYTQIGATLRQVVPLILVVSCLSAVGYGQWQAWNGYEKAFSALSQDQKRYLTIWPIPCTMILIQATMHTVALLVSSRIKIYLDGCLDIRYLYHSLAITLFVTALWFLLFSPQYELHDYLSPEELQGLHILGIASADAWLRKQTGILPVEQWIRLVYPAIAASISVIIYTFAFKIGKITACSKDLVITSTKATVPILIAIIIVSPLALSQYVERALLLPIILGAWVPLFSFLSILSMRTGVPVLIGFLLLIALLSSYDDNHSVKPTILQESPIAGRELGDQLELNSAIHSWKKVNNCESSIDGADCPELVLIGAQGGASRSAFYTVSILGNLIDENRDPSENWTKVTNKIFAMSGVSGGSLGLAFFSAALSDNLGHPHGEHLSPCRPLSELKQYGRSPYFNTSGFSNWFGSRQYYENREVPYLFGQTTYKDESKPYNISWRNCLQVLASGDFLSPTFLRLAGVDFLGLNGALGALNPELAKDRAAILENSWEEHYARIIGADSFSRNFLDFVPKLKSTSLAANPAPWQPLLLLNATSAQTGRRLIASHLYPTYCDGFGRIRRLFNDAYDLHEVLSGSSQFDSCRCQSSATGSHSLRCLAPPQKLDIKLSKAVSLSARFPILSPQADLEARQADPSASMKVNSRDRLLAQVVDGGYFENFGATTLFDLVTAIRWIQKKLPIRIVLITNDPDFIHGDCLRSKTSGEVRDAPVELPKRTEKWSVVRTILEAFSRTRGARGEEAAISLCKAKWIFDNVDFVFFHVKKLSPKEPQEVEGDADNISMSWWLSYPVQTYLDRQIASEIYDAGERNPNISEPAVENVSGFGRLKSMFAREKASKR